MAGEKGAVPLWPNREILYVRDREGVYHWRGQQGRDWCWQDGVLYFLRGVCVVPMTRVPTWQMAMQWTSGFDAGRDLPPGYTNEGN